VTQREQLIREGWADRGTFDEPRLSEVVDEYREIGFAVRVEPFEPAAAFGCAACMLAAPELYKTVYTRKTCEGETRDV